MINSTNPAIKNPALVSRTYILSPFFSNISLKPESIGYEGITLIQIGSQLGIKYAMLGSIMIIISIKTTPKDFIISSNNVDRKSVV